MLPHLRTQSVQCGKMQSLLMLEQVVHIVTSRPKIEQQEIASRHVFGFVPGSHCQWKGSVCSCTMLEILFSYQVADFVLFTFY